MNIQKIKLQNFRCFGEEVFTFDEPFVIIEGNNGSGKTTLLEALHYACYLRSFRTRSGRELVSFDQDHFFLQLELQVEDGVPQNIQIGFSGKEKVVKLNKKPIKSYKELIGHYRVISAAEDDLELVKGAPENRRGFLDQALALEDPDYINKIRQNKQILSNRNSLLLRAFASPVLAQGEMKVWTDQLLKSSSDIRNDRIAYLKKLEDSVNKLIEEHFAEDEYNISIKLEYRSKKQGELAQEIRFGRSLFGSHLDDFNIIFRTKRARVYASRGQQKLVIFLIKVAQYQILRQAGNQAIILLDDFLTDLDNRIFSKSIAILESLSCQVFITCPLKSFLSKNASYGLRHKVIKL